MSELDGISPKELEEFERKHVDTLTEIKAESALFSAKSGQFRKKNTIETHPEDKNAKWVSRHKKEFERQGQLKIQERTANYLAEAAHLRRKEALNKEDISYKDLLNALAKFLPQQIEQKSDVNMNFADMVKSVTLERKKYKAIDAEEA